MHSSPVRAYLVLVGGGHTHVQILRRWITRPADGVRLTVVLDRAEAVYSGKIKMADATGHVRGKVPNQATREKVILAKDPDKIYPGQVLRIPPL